MSPLHRLPLIPETGGIPCIAAITFAAAPWSSVTLEGPRLRATSDSQRCEPLRRLLRGASRACRQSHRRPRPGSASPRTDRGSPATDTGARTPPPASQGPSTQSPSLQQRPATAIVACGPGAGGRGAAAGEAAGVAAQASKSVSFELHGRSKPIQ